jgi:hypothetical protein
MNRCAENHHINNSTDEDAKFDRDAISAHFCNLHHAAARADIPGGKMVLAVYGEDPDTKENFASVRHFEIGDHDGMTAAAMEFDGVPHRNVYAPVVVLKPDTAPGTRKEEDIAVVLGFVIDADADKGKDAPTPPLPPDYVIESSTGNLQHFLWLDRPLPHEEAKQFGLALKRATGADSANDIGHVWRVPGALNWPNAVKVHDPKGRRGRKRSRDAQPVLVHQRWSKWTSVTALRDALSPHWEKPRTERTAVISNLDAPKFDCDRVARWIDRKVAGAWNDDPTSLSQEDWALLGKAIKISFPGEDGLELWLRLSHDPDKAVKRWNDPRDFKSEYTEGMRTLRWYFDKDTDWMFGDVEDMLNGKLIQSPPLAPAEGRPLPGAWQGEDPSEATPSAPVTDLLVSSAEFIGGFVPPEYLIDGIVQRRYFYSMTAQTGVGKTSIAMRWMAHVVTGRPIGDKEVQQGTVLYFAGENPDDVRARWLVLTRDMGIDPATKDVHWIVGAKDLNATAQQISAEVAAKGLSLAYVVIDTAAAYNVGDDENSNTQAGNYARQLRSLTNLPGGPCVVVLCHPCCRRRSAAARRRRVSCRSRRQYGCAEKRLTTGRQSPRKIPRRYVVGAALRARSHSGPSGAQGCAWAAHCVRGRQARGRRRGGDPGEANRHRYGNGPCGCRPHPVRYTDGYGAVAWLDLRTEGGAERQSRKEEPHSATERQVGEGDTREVAYDARWRKGIERDGYGARGGTEANIPNADDIRGALMAFDNILKGWKPNRQHFSNVRSERREVRFPSNRGRRQRAGRLLQMTQAV